MRKIIKILYVVFIIGFSMFFVPWEGRVSYSSSSHTQILFGSLLNPPEKIRTRSPKILWGQAILILLVGSAIAGIAYSSARRSGITSSSPKLIFSRAPRNLHEIIEQAQYGPVISESQQAHFDIVVRILHSAKVERLGSGQEKDLLGRKIMMDYYRLSDGRTIKAGYPADNVYKREV